ncbi:MAG TPA: transglutaminase family protein [Anaerolineae bacterium]|nr:transglutaminase family protein [Anaerolineae bacterium]
MGRFDARLEELRAQGIYLRLMWVGTFSLARLLVTSMGDLRRLRRLRPSEEQYVRPPRRYELPPYTPGMRVCTSDEKYLRPTRYCNHRAPEVVALAHALGAYQVSETEFARAAFEFAKEKLVVEILPLDDVVETLHRGTGTCFQCISVFIALCRAAGIKARYKMFAMNMIQAWEDGIGVDPLVKKWYDSLGYFMIEGEGEALIDGRWVVAHVGPSAERQAAGGIPITRLGEDALGIWFTARPGTIMRMESIPPGLGPGSRLLQRIAPGSMQRVSLSVLKQIERGRQIIQEAGGVRAYDEKVRSALGPKTPEVELTARPEIVFVE